MRARYILPAVLLLAACNTSPPMRGVTDSGEVFNGVATANGMWDVSGSLQLVSNRGVNCIGRFEFEGIAGPNGTAEYNCSDGRSGQATLTMSSMDTGKGQGAIGDQKIAFTWGRSK